MIKSAAVNNDKHKPGWQFDNSYARLPEHFYTRINPVPVQSPQIVIINHALADELGLRLERISEGQLAQLFSGNMLPDGAEPIAQAYAGHQFGQFTMLGDGRAHLLGEHMTQQGKRMDIQLKGSGQTPYSRRGDGRAALGPMLREYIISEAMHALGVPTTRSLAVVTTGEPVMRDSILPGGILTRVASSHLRVGTFEYLAAHEDSEGLKRLADYAIQRHDAGLSASDQPYLDWISAVMKRQIALIVDWLRVGFIHGVMNTDNMAISGETIDYGPCAFMDGYDPQTVFSSIDQMGRYAYANQPHIAGWNLARLAEALLPLIHEDQKQAVSLAEGVLHTFNGQFQTQWLGMMCRKLGLLNEEKDDERLIGGLLQWMQRIGADYTNTFRDLSGDHLLKKDLYQDNHFIGWHAHWQQRLSRNPKPLEDALALMQTANPAVIPRNHRVEAALKAAEEHADFSIFHTLLEVLAEPYRDKPKHGEYKQPPKPDERVYQTFCGT